MHGGPLLLLLVRMTPITDLPEALGLDLTAVLAKATAKFNECCQVQLPGFR